LQRGCGLNIAAQLRKACESAFELCRRDDPSA
jgi:hypothetical protein